ncbi:hypothetical protein ACFRCW_40810 [Streptomyces sp. NPDC056653]|uniref:hypothetical protein n=1 Tax=Streptomyces sp. NPDC056653 TaxID=3345894 RepID=UPI0036744E51
MSAARDPATEAPARTPAPAEANGRDPETSHVEVCWARPCSPGGVSCWRTDRCVVPAQLVAAICTAPVKESTASHTKPARARSSGTPSTG